MNVVMTVLYQKPHDNPSYETCWFDVRDSNKLDELTAKRLMENVQARVGAKVVVLFMAKLED